MSDRVRGLCIALVLGSLMAGGCSQYPCGDGPGNLRGRVLDAEGSPVARASVTLGEAEPVATDANGCFGFEGVADGEHQVSAMRELESGAFASESAVVTVKGEADTEMKLPPPVEMLPPTEVTRTSMVLHWTPFEGDGFREYRLYRNAIAEDPEWLLHATADIDETSFADLGDPEYGGLFSGTEYKYRVFAAAGGGRTAGSNVQRATTRLWDVDEFEVEYRLEEAAQIPLFGEAGGITWDGESVWVSTVETVEGVQRNIVKKLDSSGGELVRYELEFTGYGSGLAWIDGHVYLGTSFRGGSPLVREIDPASGEELRRFPPGEGLADLDFDGNHLLLGNLWNTVTFVDPASGSVDHEIAGVPFWPSTMGGVAYRPGEVWLASWAFDTLVILNDEGRHIGIAPLPPFDTSGAQVMCLAWIGDRLAFSRNEPRIRLFDVVPR